MATTRLVVVLLALGTVLLLLLQNLTPALPLVFLGSRTIALPVGLWLFGAISLGALTTLGLTALLKSAGGGGNNRRRYQYEPQPFYEPAYEPTSPAAPPEGPPPSSRSDRQAQYGAAPDDFVVPPATAAAGNWQSWTDLQSPARWESWEGDRRSPEPSADDGPGPYADPGAYPEPSSYAEPPPANRSAFSWFGRRDTGEQEQRVQDSLQEITDDWGDLERRSYAAPGGSPVDESLEEITEGWDDIESSGKQVYEGGSIYSYSYRDRASSGQTDRIYAPPDHPPAEPDYDKARPTSDIYRPEIYPDDRDEDDLGDEFPPEAGVVDADYRVIIPPPPANDTAPPPSSAKDDDWDDTDDVLTP